METPQNAVAAKELEVTGVSRSGRVRKKSSKLLDFQSPDELDKKPKRPAKPARASTAGRSRLSSGTLSSAYSVRARRPLGATDSTDDVALDEDGLDPEDDAEFDDAAGDDAILDGESSDDGLDELVADLVEGVEAESIEHTNNGESRVRQSLYMTEKANKRKLLRGGKVVTGKQERKDKGKSRYTAYSLWAREFRKTSKFSKNQDLDFSSSARRLSELWANVSNKEKSAWRRKAKLQATKAKARDKAAINVGNSAIVGNNPNTSFYNRATTSRTRKLAAERLREPPDEIPSTSSSSFGKLAPTVPKRKRNNSYKSSNNVSPAGDSAETSKTAYLNNGHIANSNSTQSPHSKLSPPNIEAIDAAAHLKLLGESLTIIGERLKEHEGQIAVSGSLSVLLDSLLCSLGPLLCLTTHIPGMEKKSELSENLASTLDNIAYVMPGL